MNARGQWTLLKSGVNANLTGLQVVDGAVWASGDHGTILRSLDEGATWSKCVAPKGTAGKDFRSIQASDASSALVMTNGKGAGSHIYRTVDGCQSWADVFTNPEAASSFDSLRKVTAKQFYLLGEPVGGKFTLYLTQDGGSTWFIADDPGLDAVAGESAAMSILSVQGPFLYFGTRGGAVPTVHFTYPKCKTPDDCVVDWAHAALPTPEAAHDVHVNAVAARMQTSMSGKSTTSLVAVGGTTDSRLGFSSFSVDGQNWTASTTFPAGERSGVGFDFNTGLLIAVGDNGTDVSTDAGRTWRSVGTTEAATGWSVLALPYAAGRDGRIGKLAITVKR